MGRLQPIADVSALALAEARRAGAQSLWQGAAVWEITDNPGPWAPVSAMGFWIRDTLSARLHPRRACHALAAALASRGAEIVPEAPDTGAVIWATGVSGLEALSAALGRPVGAAVKGQAALLAADPGAGVAQIYADALHVIAHDDGTVAVGSTSERDFSDPAGTDAALDDIVARARAAVPALADAPVITRWAGLRPRARTRAPVLGPWPGRSGHYVANGGFKIGFGMAPGVARVMADLVLEDRDRIPDGFRVSDL